MRIAVVGATGLVGGKMLEVLQERKFPATEILTAASERSVGKTFEVKGRTYHAISISGALDKQPEVALFSAGSEVSKEWAPKFRDAGIFVVDNSSAWRMEEGVPLVVPEINANIIRETDKIIANPNCSTIQMVMALAPLHQKYGIKRIIVSTYQSVSGTGAKALDQMKNERLGTPCEKVYPYNIDLNCLPHCDVFVEDGYTKEEMKLVNETRKILGDNSLRITATAVRVPVSGGHSESVNVEFMQDFDLNELKALLDNAPGVTVEDNITANKYPMPLTAHDKDEVFVGRIRRDLSNPNTVNLWVVADNLRKGAATNAVQIAEHLHQSGFIG